MTTFKELIEILDLEYVLLLTIQNFQIIRANLGNTLCYDDEYNYIP